MKTIASSLGLVLVATRFVLGAGAIDQFPQLKSLPDSTGQLQKAIDDNDGDLLLGSEEVLRITKPLVFDLAKLRAVSIRSTGSTTIVMDGPGAAIRFLGSHEGTAAPKTFEPATWHERMPTVSGIEILGNHAEADGIQLAGTVGPILRDVSIRWCRHALHLKERNRNVIVSACHFYNNSGIGVYLDDVNLHQINIGTSHISYNRQGGVVVRDGNVRNLQVTGCDIEANMPGDDTPTATANILIDVASSQNDRAKSIAEISITGCTIQHSANYGRSGKTIAPGGSNIRLAGKEIYPIDSVTISGNVLSDTTTNILVDHAQDVIISANNFFAPKPANLHVSNSRRVVVSGNTFNPRQFVRPGTIRFEHCVDCILASSTMHRFATDSGALILSHCREFNLHGLVVSECGSGIVLRDSSDVSISNSRVTRTKPGTLAVDIDRSNRRIYLNGNVFAGETSIADAAR